MNISTKLLFLSILLAIQQANCSELCKNYTAQCSPSSHPLKGGCCWSNKNDIQCRVPYYKCQHGCCAGQSCGTHDNCKPNYQWLLFFSLLVACWLGHFLNDWKIRKDEAKEERALVLQNQKEKKIQEHLKQFHDEDSECESDDSDHEKELKEKEVLDQQKASNDKKRYIDWKNHMVDNHGDDSICQSEFEDQYTAEQIRVYKSKKLKKKDKKQLNLLFQNYDSEDEESAGKDKSIKFYELPEYWRDKKLEEEERLEAQIRIDTSQMLAFSQKKAKMEEDSDEDDLAGWHLEV